MNALTVETEESLRNLYFRSDLFYNHCICVLLVYQIASEEAQVCAAVTV